MILKFFRGCSLVLVLALSAFGQQGVQLNSPPIEAYQFPLKGESKVGAYLVST